MKRQRLKKMLQLENEAMDEELHSLVSAASTAFSLQKKRAPRRPIEQQDQRMWDDGYRSWTNEKFKRKLRVERATFECILDEIRQELVKIPTPMIPHPVPPETQHTLISRIIFHNKLSKCDIYRKPFIDMLKKNVRIISCVLLFASNLFVLLILRNHEKDPLFFRLLFLYTKL